MATEILMPALSPTMEEGTLAKWLVKEGDTVQSGDLLAEIETDKATMEFEAVDEGVIGKILVAEGTEAVKVNSPIAILVEEGEEVGDVAASAPAAPAAAEAEAAPAAVEASAPAAAAAPAAPAPQAADGTRIFASPLARRIAADKGLDLTQISGTGPKGRIVKADVEGATASAPAATAAASAPAAPAAAPAPSVSSDAVAAMYQGREFEEVKLDGMRKTIAARLSEAKQTIPHFYLRRDIKLDALLAFRSQLNKQLEARGVKLSVNDFIIKAVANALQQVPEANAVWAGDRVLQMNASDVAVAVAIEGGLFTPVLQDADQKSLSSLSTQMKDLAARARDRKLAPHEYQGGSFAISNLGMFGIDNFDAIVNPPHAGILAVGTGVKKPVVGDDGELTVATIMSVTMSVDHRVIDGAVGANLLKAIVENLENPLTMLA
ncbi:pyruvate dehydrogenase complex dihydrolipoamide acetyltransferase [Aliiroseovarius crassostreae]|uniref:Acetyltransferase component of pyruvate dehydrogenase complex n=1 Tax=Aliiroseovarius crassostreae TaxID=154981 RepID=A0A9Q9M0C9_9RHOB|nr:pyruvate dehydrogenase complex dihydrolipoamide acetyltransferase [Aliiroseovarius crassostreae]UWP93238.1 pyruvate dehydrogenase complex dihydrolipoamide acetyltransferase [Aliiroseovarius crassostreae]UWP96378.1 pyruvate dehydrogenase complex dihydrolipoamide acetyltransferase [Aliiroseovarius crassostreae]UWQ09007.1 pyruvate dehydrogenase complex dihydrolipoamide acetyltransferase [Aliiroseovarius crassostreae]